MDDPRPISRLTPHGRSCSRHRTRSRAGAGAGRAPDGWIQVDSKLGRGGTFSFSIKLGHAPQLERRGSGQQVDVSRADEAYDLLDRRPEEAVQVMLTY